MTETTNTPQNRPANDTVDVAIIGGGNSGLAAAYNLEKHARQANRPLRYTLIERSPSPGGKIVTDHVLGFGDSPFIVQVGPDSFVTQKPWALQLALELGLYNDLLGTNDHKRKTFVLTK